MEHKSALRGLFPMGISWVLFLPCRLDTRIDTQYKLDDTNIQGVDEDVWKEEESGTHKD